MSVKGNIRRRRRRRKKEKEEEEERGGKRWRRRKEEEENKIKISTICILLTILTFNNNICITTKLYNKFMYNHIHFILINTFKFMYNFLQFYLNNIPTYWHQDSLHSCYTAYGFAHNPQNGCMFTNTKLKSFKACKAWSKS